MKRNSILYLIILVFILTSNKSDAQQMTPVEVDSIIVETVKEEVWIPFMESYRELDGQKFESIYTSDVTRVSTDLNQIETGEEYFKNISSFFERIKSMNLQMDITFSIVSSATSEDKVYQTGYYSIGLRKNDNDPFQSTGYAQFIVLMEKESENDSWKISLDTDKQVKLTKEEFIESGTIYQLD